MSLGVCVLGGMCPLGKCPWGKCLGGHDVLGCICPRGYVSFG